MDKSSFDTLGWAKIPYDPELKKWANNALPYAIKAANDPKHHAEWMRSQGTWFVGVDALDNDAQGRVHGSAPLSGGVLEAAKYATGQDNIDWGLGQISVCYQGYPKKGVDETDGMFNYRRNRDFAHLDGLKPVGEKRRRIMDEFHGFILGIPLNDYPAKASPFVIWEGSHIIFRDMLQKLYANTPPEQWNTIDITEVYQETRQRMFENCKRVELHAEVGEAYIAHRFSLHGMASWPDTLNGPKEGRVISYFRPYWDGNMQDWLL